MGKASSSKKVQRAARAAASSRGVGEKRERGFPLLVLAVVVLGIGLVVAARSSREPAVAPFLTDHWHSAIEVSDCGVVSPTLQTQTDPDGIHTHSDSLIHIHPFNGAATGTDASLGVFMDASGLQVDGDGIEATGSFDAGFPTIDNATGCDGEDSEIVVTRWNVDGPDGLELETTYRDDFGDIRLLHEREAFTIAKVPVGEDAPEPSAAVLAQLDASTGTTNIESEPLELPSLEDLEDLDPDAEGDPVDEAETDDTVPDDTLPDDTVPDDTVPADDEADTGTDAE